MAKWHIDTWLFIILVIIFAIEFYWLYQDRKAGKKLEPTAL